jgi:hypothetical protein
MKIGILTFEQHLGKKDIGSSRIRAKWLVNNWSEAELFVQGQKYDVVIYQKAYFVEHAKLFKGIKIFDLCDPDFLHWGYRTKEMIDECDAVTTSTEALAEALRAFTDKPVVCIPDRIDLAEIKPINRKNHIGEAKWVVWYGYSSNYEMLKPVIHFLKKLNLSLICISDKAFSIGSMIDKIEVRNYPHNWNTVYKDIIDGDIVVNPQSNKGRWKYKSNNKTIMAWALGMPVATNVEELKKFISEDERKKEQVIRDKELKEKWDIKYSVDEYKQLIDSLIKQRDANTKT